MTAGVAESPKAVPEILYISGSNIFLVESMERHPDAVPAAVMGILSLVLCFLVFVSIPLSILAIKKSKNARKEIDYAGGGFSGIGWCYTAMFTGLLGIVMSILVIFFLIGAGATTAFLYTPTIKDPLDTVGSFIPTGEENEVVTAPRLQLRIKDAAESATGADTDSDGLSEFIANDVIIAITQIGGDEIDWSDFDVAIMAWGWEGFRSLGPHKINGVDCTWQNTVTRTGDIITFRCGDNYNLNTGALIDVIVKYNGLASYKEEAVIVR